MLIILENPDTVLNNITVTLASVLSLSLKGFYDLNKIFKSINMYFDILEDRCRYQNSKGYYPVSLGWGIDSGEGEMPYL